MQQNGKNQYLQIIKGSLTGSFIFIASVLIFSFILYKTVSTEKLYLPLFIICVLISGFVSGFISTRKARKNGIITGAASTILTVLILSISTVIAEKGFDISVLIPVLLLIFSGMSGGIAAVNLKRKNKRR